MDTAPPSVLNNTGTSVSKSRAQLKSWASPSPTTNLTWTTWDLYGATVYLLRPSQPQVREEKGQMSFIQFDWSTGCHGSSEFITRTQIILTCTKTFSKMNFSWGRRMWLGRISQTERWFLVKSPLLKMLLASSCAYQNVNHLQIYFSQAGYMDHLED